MKWLLQDMALNQKKKTNCKFISTVSGKELSSGAQSIDAAMQVK
jgi:hypothetical protein